MKTECVLLHKLQPEDFTEGFCTQHGISSLSADHCKEVLQLWYNRPAGENRVCNTAQTGAWRLFWGLLHRACHQQPLSWSLQIGASAVVQQASRWEQSVYCGTNCSLMTLPRAFVQSMASATSQLITCKEILQLWCNKPAGENRVCTAAQTAAWWLYQGLLYRAWHQQPLSN